MFPLKTAALLWALLAATGGRAWAQQSTFFNNQSGQTWFLIPRMPLARATISHGPTQEALVPLAPAPLSPSTPIPLPAGTLTEISVPETFGRFLDVALVDSHGRNPFNFHFLAELVQEPTGVTRHNGLAQGTEPTPFAREVATGLGRLVDGNTYYIVADAYPPGVDRDSVRRWVSELIQAYEAMLAPPSGRAAELPPAVPAPPPSVPAAPAQAEAEETNAIVKTSRKRKLELPPGEAPGGLRLDAASRTLYLKGKSLRLPPRLHALLSRLAQRPGQTLTYVECGYDGHPNPKMTTAASDLRKALKNAGWTSINEDLVHVIGKGYRLTIPPSILGEEGEPAAKRHHPGASLVINNASSRPHQIIIPGLDHPVILELRGGTAASPTLKQQELPPSLPGGQTAQLLGPGEAFTLLPGEGVSTLAATFFIEPLQPSATEPPQAFRWSFGPSLQALPTLEASPLEGEPAPEVPTIRIDSGGSLTILP